MGEVEEREELIAVEAKGGDHFETGGECQEPGSAKDRGKPPLLLYWRRRI